MPSPLALGIKWTQWSPARRIQLVHIAFDLSQVHQPTAVAIGNFDGIHLGHQEVLQPILNTTLGIKTVLTFHPHPQEILAGRSRLLLTPPQEKRDQFRILGLEQVVQLAFTPEFAQQSPQEFIETILEQGLGARQISVGWDFNFAHQRSGNVDTLVQWGKATGIQVEVISNTQMQGARISSSRIKGALSEGDVITARQLLGRRYPLRGKVIMGDQRGRQLGFPTANLLLPEEKFLPRDGVYSVWVWLPTTPDPHPGVMNIGVRPTVDGLQRTFEVHLLDWQGDLYGQEIQVDLEGYVRSERKFGSLEELRAQIQSDCGTARDQLANSH